MAKFKSNRAAARNRKALARTGRRGKNQLARRGTATSRSTSAARGRKGGGALSGGRGGGGGK
jgi:hypothetical protein